MDKIISKLKGLFQSTSQRAGAVYLAVTIAALTLSVAVLAMILFAGDAAASQATLPDGERGKMPPISIENPLDASKAAPVPFRIEVTDETASGLVAVALRGKIEATEIGAHFSAPDSLIVNASFTKEALGEFLKAEDVPFAGALTLFAPKVLEVEVQIGVSVPEDGGLLLETRTVNTNGFKLSEHLPDSISDIVNAALASLIPDLSALKSVEVSDGKAVFMLEV